MKSVEGEWNPQEAKVILPAQHFEILDRVAFVNDFRLEAERALLKPTDPSAIAWLRSMIIEYGHAPGILFSILEKTAKAGFDTRVYPDSYSLVSTDGQLNMLPATPATKGWRKEAQRVNREVFERLRTAGGQIEYTNPYQNILQRALTVKGRSHAKLAVVRNGSVNVAWLGGENFYESSLSMSDYMVKITDTDIVAAIANELPRVNEKRRTEDVEIPWRDKETSLLFDTGIPGKSIILDKAITMVQEAKERVYLISELPPEAALLDELRNAHLRGVAVVFIGTDPKKAALLIKAFRFYQGIKYRTLHPADLHIPTLYQEQENHAKMLIADNTVIAGSNNFSQTSVNAGTVEAALLSNNKQFLANGLSYLTMVTNGQLLELQHNSSTHST